MNDNQTSNAVPQTTTNADLSDWENAPLFNQNLISQIIYAEPQINVSPESGSLLILEIDVPEENFQAKNFGARENVLTSRTDRQVDGTAEFALSKDEAPQTENHELSSGAAYEVPQTSESAVLPGSDNEIPQISMIGRPPAKTAAAPPLKVETGAARNRQSNLKTKAAKKPFKKQTYSKKREVVPVKVFVTPAEKLVLETVIAAGGTSLSNFFRLKVGLSPNQTGRKKQHVEAAFDLRELGFDDDFAFD